MGEVWKTIPGNREIYMVSNEGNVKTADRIGARGHFIKGRDLSFHKNSSGYNRVGMNLDGNLREYLVHRLVAQLFVDNPNNKPCVNHKDGNKLNNRSDNLEWCTRSENEKHAWEIGLKTPHALKGEKHAMHKLTQAQVDYIRRVHIPFDKEFGSKPLANKFNVSAQTITNIVHKWNWIETLPYSCLITGGNNDQR
jgi:hypothetical protein